MPHENKNLIVVLGSTASGKTALGVKLARKLGGEIVSADSRQVYRGLDIGSGKDLSEYEDGGTKVNYHLIDIVNLDYEFNVFDYQQRFYDVFEKLRAKAILPIMVGGTGMYVDAVLKGYRMAAVPEDKDLRNQLAALSDGELAERLKSVSAELHNTTDLEDRGRCTRAIEIAEFTRCHEPEPAPDIHALVLGTKWDRAELRTRIRTRLKERLDSGMIEEVQGLVAKGVSWEKLHFLGLEYRFIADFLQGKTKNKNDLLQKLQSAICHFAKRQDTWFRRMERRGTHIHWIEEANYDMAIEIVSKHSF